MGRGGIKPPTKRAGRPSGFSKFEGGGKRRGGGKKSIFLLRIGEGERIEVGGGTVGGRNL